MTTIQEHSTSAWRTVESYKVTINPARRETEDETKVECVAATVASMTEGKPSVLLQVNCRSIYNKALNFWNLTHNPDVVIGTESWLSEEINNSEVFRADYTTIRTDSHTRGGRLFICVKNYITCAELGVDEVYEIIVVEIKGKDPNNTWENVGIYRAPNEDMRVLEKLADRTG